VTKFGTVSFMGWVTYYVGRPSPKPPRRRRNPYPPPNFSQKKILWRSTTNARIWCGPSRPTIASAIQNVVILA